MSTPAQAAREVIGQFLKESRESKGLSTYDVRNKSGLNGEQISAIEEGRQAYQIDSLLRYIAAIDVYIYFADKKGKKKGAALDIDHITKAGKAADPDL